MSFDANTSIAVLYGLSLVRHPAAVMNPILRSYEATLTDEARAAIADAAAFVAKRAREATPPPPPRGIRSMKDEHWQWYSQTTCDSAFRLMEQLVEELIADGVLDERMSAGQRIENAVMAACETQPTWGWRFCRIMAALGHDFGEPDEIDKGMDSDFARRLGFAIEDKDMEIAQLREELAAIRGEAKPS